MRAKAQVFGFSGDPGGPRVVGTIRSDGRFRVRWYDAERREGESTFRVRAEAEAEMIEVWARICAGHSGRHPAGTFGALGDLVMQHGNPHWANHGDRAWHDLERLWLNKVSPVIGKKQASRVTQADIASVFTTLQLAGYKQATFSKVRKILNRICAEGVSQGVWPDHRNPMRNLPASITKSRHGGEDDAEFELSKTPTPAEVDRLLAAAWGDDQRVAFAMTMAARCGLRWSEATALKPEAFIWTSGKARLFIAKAKTRAGVRWVPIGPETVAIIKPLVDATPPGQYICRTKFGRPLARSNAQAAIVAARILSGYPEARGSVHYLRHFYAWSKLSEGAPDVDLSKVLGHSSPQVTRSIYAHAESVTAADRMSQYAV